MTKATDNKGMHCASCQRERGSLDGYTFNTTDQWICSKACLRAYIAAAAVPRRLDATEVERPDMVKAASAFVAEWLPDDAEIIGPLAEELNDAYNAGHRAGQAQEQRRPEAQEGRGVHRCIVEGCDWDHAGEYPLCPAHLDVVISMPDGVPQGGDRVRIMNGGGPGTVVRTQVMIKTDAGGHVIEPYENVKLERELRGAAPSRKGDE